jgi:hypothetical protein
MATSISLSHDDKEIGGYFEEIYSARVNNYKYCFVFQSAGSERRR